MQLICERAEAICSNGALACPVILGLVLHPGSEAEGACGDAADMFVEDLEERVAGAALGAPDVNASEITCLLDDSPAFREDILEGAFVLGEETLCDSTRECTKPGLSLKTCRSLELT